MSVSGLDAFTFSSFALREGVLLDRMPGELVIFGIEASGFSHGRRLTAAVKEAVCEVIATIEEGY